MTIPTHDTVSEKKAFLPEKKKNFCDEKIECESSYGIQCPVRNCAQKNHFQPTSKTFLLRNVEEPSSGKEQLSVVYRYVCFSLRAHFHNFISFWPELRTTEKMEKCVNFSAKN